MLVWGGRFSGQSGGQRRLRRFRARASFSSPHPRRRARLWRRPVVPAGPAGARQPPVPRCADSAPGDRRLRGRPRRRRHLAERHRRPQRPPHGRRKRRRRHLQLLGVGVAAVRARGGAVLPAADRHVLDGQPAVSRAGRHAGERGVARAVRHPVHEDLRRSRGSEMPTGGCVRRSSRCRPRAG